MDAKTVQVKASTNAAEELEIACDDSSCKIPQLDGESSEQECEKPNYCKLCKECSELETADDLSYHMMNDHNPEEVLQIYGRQWIDDRRYCVRKWSPFINWFSTPLT